MAALAAASALPAATIDFDTADEASLAAGAAALVIALRGADFDAQCAAAAELERWTEGKKQGQPKYAAAVNALVAAEAPAALWQLLRADTTPEELAHPAKALTDLLRTGPAARTAVPVAEVVPVLMRLVRLAHEVADTERDGVLYFLLGPLYWGLMKHLSSTHALLTRILCRCWLLC